MEEDGEGGIEAAESEKKNGQRIDAGLRNRNSNFIFELHYLKLLVGGGPDPCVS